jgi:hypothetical protein
VFTGCDVWCLWTLPGTVHEQNLSVTGTQTVHFRAKLANWPSGYAKIDPIKCPWWPVTCDKTPKVLSLHPSMMHDWTLGQNGTVIPSWISSIAISITIIQLFIKAVFKFCLRGKSCYVLGMWCEKDIFPLLLHWAISCQLMICTCILFIFWEGLILKFNLEVECRSEIPYYFWRRCLHIQWMYTCAVGKPQMDKSI